MTQPQQPGWPAGPPPQHPAPQPGWQPPTLGGQPSHGQGRDPRQPLGAPSPTSDTIVSYAPPKSRTPWLIGIGLAIVVAVIAMVTNLPGNWLAPQSSSRPSASPSASTTPDGFPFSSKDERITGRWEVLNKRWSDDGLHVELRIAVERGTLSYTFLAFANQSAEVVYPEPGSDAPALGDGTIKAGQERTGWLYFPTARDSTTIILGDGLGRQLSALVIDA